MGVQYGWRGAGSGGLSGDPWNEEGSNVRQGRGVKSGGMNGGHGQGAPSARENEQRMRKDTTGATCERVIARVSMTRGLGISGDTTIRGSRVCL